MRSFTTLAKGGLLAQFVLFFSVLYFARTYTPSAFAHFGIITSIASIAALVSGMRFDYLAFSVSVSQREKLDYYKVGLAVCTIFSFTLSIGAVTVGWLGKVEVGMLAWGVGAIFGCSLFHLGSQALLAQHYYAAHSSLRVVQAILFSVGGLTLIKVMPEKGITASFVASQTVMGAGIFLAFWKRIVHVPAEKMLLIWRTNASGSGMLSLASLTQSVSSLSPVLVGPLLFSKGEIGAYFLFSQACSAPLSTFRRSLLSYNNANPLSVVAWLRDGDRVISITVVGMIITAGLGVIAAIAPEFLRGLTAFIFDEKWADYAVLLPAMCAYYLLDCVTHPATTLLALLGRVKESFFLEAARALSTCFVIPFYAWVAGWQFIEFLGAYFVVMILINIGSIFLSCRVGLAHGHQ